MIIDYYSFFFIYIISELFSDEISLYFMIPGLLLKPNVFLTVLAVAT